MTKGRGPVPPIVGRPLAPLYGFAVARRNARFDRGRGTRSAPVPIISVGNISVGGVGKSPHVRRVVRTLQRLGRRPAIALRGYGSKIDGLSDEQSEHARELPGVPVGADPDRHAAVERLLIEHDPPPDVVVLDDGFQHRALERDLDLVLIDATRSPFRDRLLPAGWLREPASSLSRASAVVLTHADIPAEPELALLREGVERVCGAPPLAETRHAWAPEVPALIDGREEVEPVSSLRGRRALVVCAIGNPDALLWQARESGVDIAGSVVFRDHAPLGAQDAARIIAAARAAGAGAILCTSKDWTKLGRAPADEWPCPVVRPRVEIVFERGEDAFDALVASAVDTHADR